MLEPPPHPATLCPVCKKPMVHTTFGDVCMDCDQIIRHNNTPLTQQSQPHTYSSSSQPKPRLSISPMHQSSHVATQGVAYTPPRPAPIKPSISSEQRSDNDHVNLEHAKGFNQRLRARMRRLVVPELPSSPKNLTSQLELQSAITDSGLPAHIHTPAIDASATMPNEDYRTQATRQPHADLAFVQAEAIAEIDTPANTLQTPSSEADEANQPGQQNNITPLFNSPKFLLASISIAAILVLVAGLWATQYNTAQRDTKKPADQATTTQRPVVSAEVTQRDNQRKADLNSLATALEVYKQQLGTYPAGDDIKVLYPLQYTTPPYITIVNYDPSSDENTKIKYNYSSDGSSFTIVARLEDPSDPDALSGYYVVRNK